MQIELYPGVLALCLVGITVNEQNNIYYAVRLSEEAREIHPQIFVQFSVKSLAIGSGDFPYITVFSDWYKWNSAECNFGRILAWDIYREKTADFCLSCNLNMREGYDLHFRQNCGGLCPKCYRKRYLKADVKTNWTPAYKYAETKKGKSERATIAFSDIWFKFKKENGL